MSEVNDVDDDDYNEDYNENPHYICNDKPHYICNDNPHYNKARNDLTPQERSAICDENFITNSYNYNIAIGNNCSIYSTGNKAPNGGTSSVVYYGTINVSDIAATPYRY